NVTNSEFRSNHASNYLPIKAHLPEDKEETLHLIDLAIKNPSANFIRSESMRGL
ncbi:MAG: radical SAM protein, partial [Deltaproteobacteria bacterium]|nr:radical SAM protein [Deltaproteobacteria bacterium]